MVSRYNTLFSSPIGDLFILIIEKVFNIGARYMFSSPIGDLFILIIEKVFNIGPRYMFSSPIGDLFILIIDGSGYKTQAQRVLVPYRGLIYFNS